MKKNKKSNQFDDFVKANRRGSREAELENDGKFKSTTRVHKNLKKYSRKNSINDLILEEW